VVDPEILSTEMAETKDTHRQPKRRIRGWLSSTDDWYEPGEREPQKAWVVDWMDPDVATPMMHRALVEVGETPADDDARRAELIAMAEAVIAQGKPPEPAGFGFAPTGSETRAELFERVKLTIYAVDTASGRVGDAARRKDDFAATALSVALVEALAWIRGLDELMTYIWRNAVTPAGREIASLATDDHLGRLQTPPRELIPATTKRERDGKAYADWTYALIAKGAHLSRNELQGMRWLAGKLLHFGPLPAAELRHWRAGAEPRWKWRAADRLFPPPMKEQQPEQRAAYEQHLRGRDVVGTVSMIDTLIEAEYLFYRLLRNSDEEQGLEWKGT
jgi:hypothetical protein